MAIDPERDTLIPAAKLIEQKTGRRPSPQQSWRWRTRGVNGARLECVRIGSQWYTTEAAFSEFIRAQSGDSWKSGSPVTPPKEREDQMRRRLKAAGLM